MLEFILTPRKKYLRNFSMSGGLQTYFTTLLFTCVFCLLLFTFCFPSVLFYSAMNYTRYQQGLFFFLSEKQAINHVLAIFPLAVTNAVQYLLLSIDGTWKQNTGWAVRMLDAHKHRWSPNPGRCFAATIRYNLQLHLLMYQYREFRGLRKPGPVKESMGDS